MSTTSGVADVVFCLDASASMRPCIEEVCKHIDSFLAGLKAGGQFTWNLRFDFIAHRGSTSGQLDNIALFTTQSIYYPEAWYPLYKDNLQNAKFFTSDIGEFKNALNRVNPEGDEAPLVGLDFCLDLPWRPSETCHRVVILMTDEPFETGIAKDWQKSKLQKIIDKIIALRVMLYLVAPQSEFFDSLAAVPKCEYTPVDITGDGLASVNFAKVLEFIGRSVSKGGQGQSAGIYSRGLFDQVNWGQTNNTHHGR